MTRTHKIVNLVGVALPFVGAGRRDRAAVEPRDRSARAGAADRQLRDHLPRRHASATTGCSPIARSSPRAHSARVIAVLGSMAVEGSVITWVADHRKHHAFTDREGDPHSPHLARPRLVGRDQGPVARAHRLAVRDGRHRRPRAVRARPGQGPGAAGDRQAVPAVDHAQLRDPVRARVDLRRRPRRRADRAACGAASCGCSCCTT